jgi:hypothetical protein
MLVGLLDADVSAKTGRGTVQTAVEHFVVQCCSA